MTLRDIGELHAPDTASYQGRGLLASIIQQTDKDVIREVIKSSKNRSEAIKILGISRRTFYTKIKQYNLD